MTDIVNRLRRWAENDMRVEGVCLEAADEIEQWESDYNWIASHNEALIKCVQQYADDLRHRPQKESIKRRLKMIEDVLNYDKEIVPVSDLKTELSLLSKIIEVQSRRIDDLESKNNLLVDEVEHYKSMSQIRGD